VRLWAGYDGCRATVRRGVPPTRSIVAQKPARVTVYGSDCRGNGHVELWTVPGGPHIPPLTLGFATQVVDYLLAHPKR
jgi:polyhydroxybutyrate depolymerase